MKSIFFGVWSVLILLITGSTRSDAFSASSTLQKSNPFSPGTVRVSRTVWTKDPRLYAINTKGATSENVEPVDERLVGEESIEYNVQEVKAKVEVKNIFL